MSYKLELDHSWDFCPVIWQNFVNSLSPHTDNGVNREIIDRALLAYNAVGYDAENGNEPCVVFNDKYDFVIFKLKYSS